MYYSLAGVKKVKGKVVSPSTPRTESGTYWGYTVRVANSLGAVFTECPYKDGYDTTLGTSERGDSVDKLSLPQFRYCIHDVSI